MSTTKASGTTRLGRDSQAKRLGVKLFAGQKANPGSIIIRQRGSKVLAGKNVRQGSDDTLYAVKSGVVEFSTKNKTRYDGNKRTAKVVHVV
jgi:large subunit ribosomal protein L27